MGPFAKPALTAQHLIALMRGRGLVVSNEPECLRALRHVGYYRLSGYMLPFQVGGPAANRHDFKPGTDFQDILDLYTFDRRLRLVAMDALERIEIALRTALTDTLAVPYGPHWYLDRNHFTLSFDHAAYEQRIRDEIHFADPGKQDVFVRHYYSTYNAPDMPPSWMAFESVNFGTIASTIRHLLPKEQIRVSRVLNIPEVLLHSWCLSLSYCRNLCAHHSRFWNRTFTIKPFISKQYAADLTPNHTAYAQLVTMQVLMRTISPASRWQDRLEAALVGHPNVPPSRLGFPPDWKNRHLWR